jgi:hypothetical protein
VLLLSGHVLYYIPGTQPSTELRKTGLRMVQGIHVAHHEAGHFVAHHYLVGNGTTSLAIVPDGKGGFEGENPVGYNLRTLPDGEIDPAVWESEIVTLYAGAAAELRLDAAREDEVRLLSKGDADAAAYFLSVCLDEPEREAELRGRAAAFVAEHWSEIEAVASELMLKKSLHGEVALLILRLVNGSDIDMVSKELVARFGPEEAAALLRRHRR